MKNREENLFNLRALLSNEELPEFEKHLEFYKSLRHSPWIDIELSKEESVLYEKITIQYGTDFTVLIGLNNLYAIQNFLGKIGLSFSIMYYTPRQNDFLTPFDKSTLLTYQGGGDSYSLGGIIGKRPEHLAKQNQFADFVLFALEMMKKYELDFKFMAVAFNNEYLLTKTYEY
jgi:hypothetical protein